MAEWGRKHYRSSWPFRVRLWSIGAFLLTGPFFLCIFCLDYWHGWTTAQRLYLPDYIVSGFRGGGPNETSRHKLLEGATAQGQYQLLTGDQVEPITGPDGKLTYRLTDKGTKDGLMRLEWRSGLFNDRRLHGQMASLVFENKEPVAFFERSALASLAFFAVLQFFAVSRDHARRRVWQHGRRLRGPELVSTTEFNKRLGSWKGMLRSLPDGVKFVNEEDGWISQFFRKDSSRWARIARDREAMHFLIVGDSGTGKSATIRQMLAQVSARGEAAIVYDPAMEYLPQFYSEERGDVVLNPLDARCPFWSPGDEVPHEAEALTLAASLFPDQGRDNRFFVEAPRKIFAHLLNLKPTPQELTRWMSNGEEIDKRVEGTELQSMIDRNAAAQRSGVLGSLNMVADAFKLLPADNETARRWSTVEWARSRKGWIFLTSKPTMRERLRPLMSLWLDLLILRLMNEQLGTTTKTWFVLDELASLQRLPQLMTAVTENRKSNNPMVLGFQGKAQVETLYGHLSEAMLSQPATKIFLKTSEPNASEWISKAIGEIEVERFRESRMKSVLPGASGTEQREITREPLVMASEIGGLDPLHGYLKHGNLVLRMRFPYMELPILAEKFVERKLKSVVISTASPSQQPAAMVAQLPQATEPGRQQPKLQQVPPRKDEHQEHSTAVKEQTPFFE